jgi:hypothetical protein
MSAKVSYEHSCGRAGDVFVSDVNTLPIAEFARLVVLAHDSHIGPPCVAGVELLDEINIIVSLPPARLRLVEVSA